MSTSLVIPNNSEAAFDMETPLEPPLPPASEPLVALSAALAGLQEAACIIDEELRVRAWNNAMSGLTGLTKSQALWQPLFSLLPRNFKQSLEGKCLDAFEQANLQNFPTPEPASTWEGEIQQYHGRELFLTFRYRFSLFGTETGKPLAMLSLRELRHERMLKKQFEFREQLNLLGMINASVAQELSGALELICYKLDEALKNVKESAHARFAQDLEEIVPQVYRLGYLINNIVCLGRDVAPQLAFLDVNEAVREAHAALEHIQKRKISCVSALTPALPEIAADPILLQLVLQNVLKYALEAAGEDVVPRVHTTAAMAEEGVFIHVEDRGPELDEETLTNFFDPAHSTARWGLAIGLGLLLSKKIVEAHHGSLEVSSRAGSGTKLSIFLPVTGQAPMLG